MLEDYRYKKLGRHFIEYALLAVIIVCGIGLSLGLSYSPKNTQSYSFGVKPARAANSTCPNWLVNADCITDGSDVREETLAPNLYYYVTTHTHQWYSPSPVPEWLGERWLSCFDLLERAPWLQDKIDTLYPDGYHISDYAIAFGTTTNSYFIELTLEPSTIHDAVLCVSYPSQGTIPTAGVVDIVWEK